MRDSHVENRNNTGASDLLKFYNDAVTKAEANGYNVDKYKDIVDKGADYVAQYFAWEAAGYDWYSKGLNSIVDNLDPTKEGYYSLIENR